MSDNYDGGYDDEAGGDGFEEMTDAELQAYDDTTYDDGADDAERRERYAFASGAQEVQAEARYDAELDRLEDAYGLHSEAEQQHVIDAAVRLGRQQGIEVTDAEFPQVVEQAIHAERGSLIAMRANSGRFRMSGE